MAAKVIKVENKALKISDGVTKIPVLVATISDYENALDTSGAVFILMNQIAARARGLVTSCGYHVMRNSSEAQYQLVTSLPNPGSGSTYGDDTGFKLGVSCRTVGEASAQSDITISYLGQTIMIAYVFTGYGDFECSLPVLFVDENNNLLISSINYIRGIFTTSNDPYPLAIAHSKYLVTHYTGAAVYDSSSFYFPLELYNSHRNMDDDFTDPNDPFDNDEDSDEGGGSYGGDQDNWDGDGDEIPVPGLPDLSAVDTGFITLFNPTIAQLQNLASYMWSGLFDVATFRKIVADPMDVILGLSIVPVDVPASSVAEVMVGNISTGVYMLKASSQYVELNCGTIKISEKDHSYLDYSPYTKVTIILPYIGAQELSIDELNGQTIGVVYHIDVLSGACVAFITIGGNVVHQYAGQCAVSIPITSKDFTQTIQAICQLVGSGIGAGVGIAATGGMSAPISAAMVAGGVSSAASGAMNVINSKPTFSKTGSIAGAGGLLSVQKPYLIFERPKKCKPANQQTYTGYPSIVTRSLGSLFGFTQVREIHLDGIPCTDAERDEMLTLMREGIIL